MKETQNEGTMSQRPPIKDQQAALPQHPKKSTESGRMVIGYIIMQLIIYGFAITNLDNFEVALAWIVVSIAFSQSVSEFITFTSERIKKIVTLSGILMPAIIALAVAYLG